MVESLSETFLAQVGIGIHGTFGAVGAMKELALTDEPCDLAILTAAMIDDLVRGGLVARDTVATLGRVRTAIAVREGDSHPDISNRDVLRRLMLDAGALYVPDTESSTAGIHFAKVLRALAVYEEVRPRLRSFPSGAIAMRALAQGTEHRAVGCTQVTEIRYTPGVSLVGPLPSEFELATAYSVGVFVKAHQPDPARRFVELLSGREARELRLHGGFED